LIFTLFSSDINKFLAAPLNCIAYEPFNNPFYPSQVEKAVNSDLTVIKKAGFSCIKTYYSQYYGLKIAQYAQNYHLKIVLGIWMEDNSFIESEINSAIESCKNNDNIVAIYTGNENLPKRNIDEIIRIKNRLKNSGCKKPFGTVQTIGYFLNQFNKNLINEFDFFGYNVYPFFSKLPAGDLGQTALTSLLAQISQMSLAYGANFNKFLISETGWPSEGSKSPQGNTANLNNAKAYAENFTKLLGSKKINTPWVSYFTFFDPTYKKWAPDYERNFGVANEQGIMKWDSKLMLC
jgi:exo-beta-1,3-glucanase (GH17 family)